MRSSVFKAMFSGDIKRNKTVDLKGFDCKTLQSFCDFLYTNQLTFAKEMAIGMHTLSVKYNVQELKEMARAFLLDNITEFNQDEVFNVSREQPRKVNTVASGQCPSCGCRCIKLLILSPFLSIS